MMKKRLKEQKKIYQAILNYKKRASKTSICHHIKIKAKYYASKIMSSLIKCSDHHDIYIIIELQKNQTVTKKYREK